MALSRGILSGESSPARWGVRHRSGAKRRAVEGRLIATPRPLATERLAKAEHAVPELAALLDAEVRVTEIILEALQARILGLKVIRLGRLLVAG
jgi:hypothetical protein